MASTRCASSLRDNRWRPWAARHRNGTRADRSTPVPWLTPQCMTRHRPPARPPARRARYGRTPHAPWRFWPCGLQDVSARVASHSPAATGRTGGPPFRRPIRRRRADQAARTPRRAARTRDRTVIIDGHDDPRRCDGKRPTTERDDPHHARGAQCEGQEQRRHRKHRHHGQQHQDADTGNAAADRSARPLPAVSSTPNARMASVANPEASGAPFLADNGTITSPNS